MSHSFASNQRKFEEKEKDSDLTCSLVTFYCRRSVSSVCMKCIRCMRIRVLFFFLWSTRPLRWRSELLCESAFNNQACWLEIILRRTQGHFGPLDNGYIHRPVPPPVAKDQCRKIHDHLFWIFFKFARKHARTARGWKVEIGVSVVNQV